MVTTTTESSPSSRLRFFDESAVEVPSPAEGSTCGILIDVRKEFWLDISLMLGTYPLNISFDEKLTLAFAKWPPCGPGHYELLLVWRDFSERRIITVVPKYFTESDFTSMIHELTESLPKSIALQLSQCGAQLGKNLTLDRNPTVEDEYLKVRRAIVGTKERPGLLQILPIIQRECHQVLIPRTEIRNANRVRRPDISKLPQAMTMPGNVLSVNKIYQMFDVTVESSFDTYENRLVKEYVKALRSRLSRLQATMTQAPPAMASELNALINEFNLACARATFLREVKLPSVFAVRITMVLLKNPAYRAVLEDYLALNQQSSVTLEEAALSNPLNEFPFLYELWANLRVLNALLQVCVESGYRCISHRWVKRFNKGIFIQVTNDHEAAIELSCPTTGRLVTLVTWSPQGGSEVLNPPNHKPLMALAIAINTPGKLPVVLLFDPEYRVVSKSVVTASEDKAVAKKGKAKKTSAKKSKGKTIKTKAVKPETVETLNTIEPMKEDIDELVRCMDLVKTPDGVRGIHYAAILCPGQSMQVASGVEAVSALPSDGDGLQKVICDVFRRYLV